VTQESHTVSNASQNTANWHIGSIMLRLACFCLVASLSSSCFAQPHPGAEEFAQKAAAEFELDPKAVLELLGQAQFKQSIVDAISRPAEGKP